mmetsp:Transcript_37651/g.118658  ORF Transcript_37651/g.118658 Transcript_37651/m.118658 type:complete len:343 (-) Transcript_37651:6132-7160(-)
MWQNSWLFVKMRRRIFAVHLLLSHLLLSRNASDACLRTKAERSARNFRSHISRQKTFSSCPNTKWLQSLAAFKKDGAHIFFDVGCNKGYESINLFSTWQPRSNISPSRLHSVLQRRKVEKPCGNCNDCRDQRRKHRPQNVHQLPFVHCFEPNGRLVDVLQEAADKLLPGHDRRNWLIHHTAVSNTTNLVRFKRRCQNEKCSIVQDSSSIKDSYFVNSTTIDSVLSDYDIKFVDIMKIDAEGYDPAVLLGAHNALSAGAFGVVQFEYHGIGLWKTATLKNVIESMDGQGYTCFFDGRRHLTRITGCWSPHFEFHDWSNVVCGNRRKTISAQTTYAHVLTKHAK